MKPKEQSHCVRALSCRKKAAKDPSLEPLRVRLSKNTEDLDALNGIGKAFLSKGDFHAARLVFAKAGQAGGGPLESNLLGVACYRAGDITCGLDAFAQAASGGAAAGRDNLVTALEHWVSRTPRRKHSMLETARAAYAWRFMKSSIIWMARRRAHRRMWWPSCGPNRLMTRGFREVRSLPMPKTQSSCPEPGQKLDKLFETW